MKTSLKRPDDPISAIELIQAGACAADARDFVARIGRIAGTAAEAWALAANQEERRATGAEGCGFDGDGDGYGFGDGYGDGYGYGYGYGFGDGHGYGYGVADGYGDGYGVADGYGDGYGYGNGFGDGHGLFCEEQES